jgi:hypothetical protein
MVSIGMRTICLPGAGAMGLIAAFTGCAARTPALPGTGTVTVGVVTSGPDVARLAFRLLVDGNPVPRTIRADAGVLSTSLPAGEHVLALGELPDRCRVDGASERRITVSENRVTPVKFAVVCR